MENEIFFKMKASLVVLAVLCVYPCAVELVSLVPLPSVKLKTIDKKTTDDIINQVLNTIEVTVKEQNKLALACEIDINKTMASCEACAADLCQPQPPPLHEQLFIGLVSEAKKPLVIAGNLVKDIGSHLNVFKHLNLGKLSSVTNTIKDTLLGGTEQVFSEVISGLENTGKTIADVAKNAALNTGKVFGKFGLGIGKFAGKIGTGIGGFAGKFGKGFGSLVKNVGGGVVNVGKHVGKHLESFGKGFVNTGKSIGDGIKSIFGKRSTRHILHKRCAKSCPVCDTLDTKKYSKEKIVENVCGKAFVSKQKKVQDKLKNLEEVYNHILKKNPVVKKIEFDKSSRDTEDFFNVMFKKTYVTFRAGKNGKTFKFPWKFNVGDIDGMAVKVSQLVRTNIF